MRDIKSTGGLTRKRGFTDEQRTLWIESMTTRADVTRALRHLNQSNASTNIDTCQQSCSTDPDHRVPNKEKYYKQDSHARIEQDFKDITHVKNFLSAHSPFQCDSQIRCIITGEAGNSKSNPDNAEAVGETILQSMDGKVVSNAKFSKSMTVANLLTKSAVIIDNEPVCVDQMLLFQRLLMLADRLQTDQTQSFKYELCTFPPSLFDSKGFFYESRKHELSDFLWKKHAQNDPRHLEPVGECMFVIDGGALLYHIDWQKSKIFGNLFERYVTHIRSNYGNAIIVFDGYADAPSTKDMAHVKRCGATHTPTVVLTDQTVLSKKREIFLSNPKNKQEFINNLGFHLTKANYKVVHADGDADSLIVKTAIEEVHTKATTVICEDTDVLCMLLYHCPDTSRFRLVMRPNQSKTLKKQWDVQQLRDKIGHEICDGLLFAHAFSGCDTTSRIFGIGKLKIMKLLESSSEVRKFADDFMRTHDESEKNDILKSGENMMKKLYSGADMVAAESLDDIRFALFKQKAASNVTQVLPTSLPPTA